MLSRREFGFAAVTSVTAFGQTKLLVPVGLQQTAVAKNLQQDLPGTLRAVAGMGYGLIEFSATTFMKWTPAETREVRKVLDEVNLGCRSTHNEIASFSGDGLSKALELNHILGSDTLVSVRGPGTAIAPANLDTWKRFSDQLSQAVAQIRAAGMKLGFHNHEVEFRPVEGTRPIDILAGNPDITAFHLNIGLALKGGGDPVAFIRQCHGRIQTVLCQDFEGKAKWNEIFEVSESVGGLEFYLIQHTDGLSLQPGQSQGGDLLEIARTDLAYFRKLKKKKGMVPSAIALG